MAKGDLVVHAEIEGVLTAQERAALAQLVNRVWPGPLADVEQVQLYKDSNGDIQIRVSGERTFAPNQLPDGPLRIRRKVP